MFEEYTHERMLEDVLNNAPEGIDTRKGGVFYDAVNGILIKVAKLYTDLDLVIELSRLTTTTGEALDAKAGEYGLTRLAATKAKYKATLEGVSPQAGERFYYDGAYFTLKKDEETGVAYFEAEVAGESGNTIYSGTPAVPVNNIDGLVSATFGEVYERGSDAEDDESLRSRVIEKIGGPAENGNKQHYKTWCESIDGVGRARIFPLWNGENTVKAVLIDTTGKPCGEAKVLEVQNYIDPADKGMTAVVGGKTYTVGDGLGNGVANIGAHFTAAAATALTVKVTFGAELASGADKEDAQDEAAAAIEDYLEELVLEAEDDEKIVVRISAIGAILSNLKSLVDYSDLRLNGGTSNITPGEDDVPVLGEVKIE